MNTTEYEYISGTEVLERNLTAFHIWGHYKGELVNQFVCTPNPSKDVIKPLFKRARKLYASPCMVSLNDEYLIVNP